MAEKIPAYSLVHTYMFFSGLIIIEWQNSWVKAFVCLHLSYLIQYQYTRTSGELVFSCSTRLLIVNVNLLKF